MSANRCFLYDEVGANAKIVLWKDYAATTSFDVILHPLSFVLSDNKTLAADVGSTVRAAAQFNRDGSVTAQLNPGATWRGTRAGIELTSANAARRRGVKASVVQEGLLPGLRVGAEWALRECTRVAASYRHAFFSVRGEVSAEARPNATAAAAVFHPRTGLLAGGLVTYALRAPAPAVATDGAAAAAAPAAVARAEGCIGFASQSLEVTAYTTALGRAIGCSVFKKLDRRTSVAVDANFDTTKAIGESGAPRVEAGVQYQIDSSSFVKAKVATDTVVSFSYVHQLSRFARAVLSGSITASNLSHTGNHTFGFSLVLSD